MKTLTIKSCTECRYYEFKWDSLPLCCNKKERVIDVFGDFPDWCPLPDYKEMKDADR